MFPVGDPGTGGVQCHTKWCGPEHPCHLHIGSPPVGISLTVRLRLGRCWQRFRRIAEGLLAHRFVLTWWPPGVRAMKRDIAASVLATMTTSAVRWNCAAGLVCQVRRIDRPVPWDRCRRERAIASRERCGSLRIFLANEFARAGIERDDRRGSDKRKQAPPLGLFEPEARD